MAKLKKLPSTIFVKIHEPATARDEAWLDATDDPHGHAEIGEAVTIGIYKLEEVKKLRTKITADPA